MDGNPIIETPGQKNSEIPETKPGNFQSYRLNFFVILVLASLVFGSIGGVFGALYLVRLPGVQKFFPSKEGSSLSAGTIKITEDSAVIDVVKKASPAVVSIVISKDLNKIPGFGLSPFDSSPFFFQFFGQQPGTNSSQPNVQEVGAGSGFLVSQDGLILTNKHVVADEQASYTVITSDKKSYAAKVLARDSVNDLAILQIDIKNALFLTLAGSDTLQIGQHVIAIGNSLGQYQNTVTSGIVSGIGRSITADGGEGSEHLQGVIQTDAAINPGNSGGPLLNLAGQVVGINTAIDQQGQLVGFAIPSNDVSKALASFQKNGKIIRPFLGVRYIILNKNVATQKKLPKDFGALILRGQNYTDFAIIPGSPADKAGLVENDIILEVNGNQVNEDDTLSSLLAKYNAGDNITLKVYHKGEEKTINVTLGEAK